MTPAQGQKVAGLRERVQRACRSPPNCHSVDPSQCAFRSNAGTVVAIRRLALSNALQRSARVLLVEDDSALGELFAQVLVERGHEVELATDVPAAIEQLAR